eukprot:5837839-Pyramimonas_sp.AAC.1
MHAPKKNVSQHPVVRDVGIFDSSGESLSRVDVLTVLFTTQTQTLLKLFSNEGSITGTFSPVNCLPLVPWSPNSYPFKVTRTMSFRKSLLGIVERYMAPGKFVGSDKFGNKFYNSIEKNHLGTGKLTRIHRCDKRSDLREVSRRAMWCRLIVESEVYHEAHISHANLDERRQF